MKDELRVNTSVKLGVAERKISCIGARQAINRRLPDDLSGQSRHGSAHWLHGWISKPGDRANDAAFAHKDRGFGQFNRTAGVRQGELLAEILIGLLRFACFTGRAEHILALICVPRSADRENIDESA